MNKDDPGAFFSSFYIFTTSSQYEEINFWYDRDNQATIIPKTWSTSSQVDAHFTIDNLLKHLPKDFSVYRVTFLEHANVTPQEVDTIFTWSAANDIKAYDESIGSDLTLMLWQRVFEFNTKNLHTLSLLLRPRAAKEIDATSFFDSIGSLKHLYLYVTLDVSDSDMHEFIEKQRENKYLNVKIDGDNVIKITRKSALENVFGRWGN